MTEEEDVIIDHHADDEHPQVLTNNNTPYFWSAVNYVWKIAEGNGYLFILGAIVAYYVYQKSVSYLESKVKKSDDVMSKLSPQEQMDRLEGMRRARMKLQQDVDEAAAVEAQKMKEREERARQEKIDDWERHVRGEGYKSKTKANDSSSSTLKKDNYNPLMGSGSTGGFKSSRPRRGGGGGG